MRRPHDAVTYRTAVAAGEEEGFNNVASGSTNLTMMRAIRRSIWQAFAVVALLLMLALGLMLLTSLRSLERLRPVHTHLGSLYALQSAMLDAQEASLDANKNLVVNRNEDATVAERLSALQSTVRELVASRGYLDETTSQRLEEILGVLRQGEDATDLHASLDSALEELRIILRNETEAQDRLLRVVERDTERELMASAALTVSLPILAIVFVFLMRRRFLLPLYNLRDLMSALGRPDYPRVSTSDLDPLLRPVFENYNHMVARLAELERKHRDRQQSLEEEVRAATRALLQQQRELSRAERMAAVGELAAGVAHELRNPLAGVQMALGGIRSDTPDPESGRRLDLVITEIKRVTRLLNDLLNLSRRTPEPPVELELVKLVNELAGLLRYQLPEDVALISRIPGKLTCRLPEDGLRQALLNLILNGAQAIGDRPGQIVVSADHSEGRVKISVADNGPGFPEGLLERGVRAFSTRRPGGTGLGLATVRRFARDLGGDLILRNVDSNGACATIDLPEKVTHG